MKGGRTTKRLLIAAALILIIVFLLCLGIILLVQSGVSQDPESVAYDYQMSLIRGRYQRAYAHLSPGLANWPVDAEMFAEDLGNNRELPQVEMDPCVYIESTTVVGDEAEVRMRLQYYDPCMTWLYPLFPSLREVVYNLSFNEFTMRLQREGGEWRVVDSGEHFVDAWR